MNQENCHVQFVLNNIISLLYCVSILIIDIYIREGNSRYVVKCGDFMLNVLDYKYFSQFLIVKLLKFR